ncbi:urea ABC transporter permease subunit UrtB [Verrucomicrobiota bacterium sgz303538]
MPLLWAIYLVPLTLLAAENKPRAIIQKALFAEDADEQANLVSSLAESATEETRILLTAWREGSIYFFEQKKGEGDDAPVERIPVTLDETQDAEGKQLARRVDTGELMKDAKGEPLHVVATDLTAAETDSNLRKAMKSVLDLASLAAPDLNVRKNAVTKLGMEQNPARLPALVARQKTESNSEVQRALREAIALIQLKSEDPNTQIAAAKELGEMDSMMSVDFLKALLTPSTAPRNSAVVAAAKDALAAIERHTKFVNFYGTLFRGLSLGSVLLVVAIGLAITFGLMGVINMAHGELIAVGAYATYIVQNIFGAGLALSPFGMKLWIPGFNAGGALYDCYFLVALPVAFISAALVGIALERGIIQFLYRRPLESLLATWGVSLVLQQLFRLVFGANNVQVYSPSWLSGNWTVFDVILGWNRVFVIGFAVVIIIGTWAILNKTPLGLLIRAVMQNRAMAACMGVRTERVNMLTFGFGSGLAGLAGAFLSQIGNVGPSLGQSYIVDSFMTVVVGGVGSLAGAVISALGIGVVDQSLQQILLNPVLGKILVLAAIILFLQWRPAGLFTTKSRSLEG